MGEQAVGSASVGTAAPPESVCLVMTLGCPRSEADIGRIHEYIGANGWRRAATIEEADVVIVTTCGFCADFEERSIAMLHIVDERRRPDSRLIITGCLAAISDERLHSLFDASTVTPRQLSDFDRLLKADVPIEEVRDANDLDPYIEEASRYFSQADMHPGDSSVMRRARALSVRTGVREWVLRNRGHGDGSYVEASHRVFSIRVAAGCMGDCTFCAIKFAAGPLRSKPLEMVLEEFDAGLAAGYTDFRFIAGDLGSYGQDIGTSIADLLEAIMERPGRFLLTLTDFDLRFLIKYERRITEVLAANCRRIRNLEIPMQSGSERTLQRMRRQHTAADAKRALKALRAACPSISITTHVLVGFPGETEDDFEDTLRLLRAAQFNCVTFYDYADRPRTEAAAMPDHVPQSVIRERSLRGHREFCGPWDALRYRAKAWGLH